MIKGTYTFRVMKDYTALGVSDSIRKESWLKANVRVFGTFEIHSDRQHAADSRLIGHNFHTAAPGKVLPDFLQLSTPIFLKKAASLHSKVSTRSALSK